MATSGTSAFNFTRDQIIRTALRKVGAFQSGETPDAGSVNDAADCLNMMVKEWDTLGIHLWTESEGILFLQPSQIQYAMGPTATDQATQTNPPNYIQTALLVAAAASASTIQVTSIVGMLNGDHIGIVLTSGVVFWTTINGVPSGSTITLAAILPSAAAIGNTVFDYTTSILRPLRIVDARRFVTASGIETGMIKLSRLDYRDLPNKTNTGVPTSYFYDPLGGASANGIFYVWPAPIDASSAIKFTWYRQIQDFNNPGDNPDFPNEWINALVWNLAAELAPEYDLTGQRFALLKSQADAKLQMVFGWDRESESIYFGPAMDYPQGRQ